ncbi:hypothetical protein BU17DRAFT_69136 [Hysterangium stoloniferum]|nr:hypothetical protein BU17DRAFT_69136 [Hysterangium stoloniferum]
MAGCVTLWHVGFWESDIRAARSTDHTPILVMGPSNALLHIRNVNFTKHKQIMVPKIPDPLSLRMANPTGRLSGNGHSELQTIETSNQDDSTYKDPQAVPGIDESPHLFEAPPITTTTNIAINDSCDRDKCESMECRKTQRMTEVVTKSQSHHEPEGRKSPTGGNAELGD